MRRLEVDRHTTESRSISPILGMEWKSRQADIISIVAINDRLQMAWIPDGWSFQVMLISVVKDYLTTHQHNKFEVPTCSQHRSQNAFGWQSNPSGTACRRKRTSTPDATSQPLASRSSAGSPSAEITTASISTLAVLTSRSRVVRARSSPGRTH